MSAIPLVAVPTEADLEFDRQVDALAPTGLSERLDLAEGCFRAWLEPLRDVLPAVGTGGEGIPFVVVVPDLPVVDVLATGHRRRRRVQTLEPDDLARFPPLPELDVPPPYLLSTSTRARTPWTCRPGGAPGLTATGRSPLTVAEGLAVLVSDPGVLRSRDCFSLLGSRAGDKRVPALWVSGRRPRLGWCWAGAPHTWLGSASCGGRVAEAPRASLIG